MADTNFPFPYDVDNLLAGAVRILYAPVTEAVPTSIASVVDMTAPYAPNGGWKDLGATKESFSYTRGFDTESLEIQQTSAEIFREITSVTRTIECSLAELNEETLGLIEGNSAAAGAVAGAANVGAQAVRPFGAFSSLDRYRFAFISRRNKASGQVTEPGGATRGRFVMGVVYQAELAAADSTIEQAKGALTAAGVSWTCFPDSTQDANEEYGAWYFENTGVIAGA